MSKRERYDFEVGFFESLLKRMPKDVRVVTILAHLYTESGQIDAGLRMDRRLVRLIPDDPTANYNLACSLALKQRPLAALQILRTAVRCGYDDFEWMCNDPDLGILQNHPDFLAFLKELGREKEGL